MQTANNEIFLSKHRLLLSVLQSVMLGNAFVGTAGRLVFRGNRTGNVLATATQGEVRNYVRKLPGTAVQDEFIVFSRIP